MLSSTSFDALFTPSPPLPIKKAEKSNSSPSPTKKKEGRDAPSYHEVML
jgi:hypothetical protein